MTIDPKKYIVFKRNTLFELMGELVLDPERIGGDTDCAPIAQHVIERVEQEELDDAVVIRKGDTFACGALYGYATGVQTTIEILKHAEGILVDPAVIEHLSNLADFFAGEADHSRQLKGHIPT